MTQNYKELEASDLLSDSRAYLNDSNEAIVTLHAGESPPTSTFPFMLWADTSAGKLKQRNAADQAWVVIGDLGAEAWGLLSKAGGNMTGAIDMGGEQITNLPTGSGTSAVRQEDVDLKAPLAAPALTGDATVDQDPAGPNSITRKSWTDDRYLHLTGGTVTGAVASSGYAGGSTEFVPKSKLEDLRSFNTSTGHRHDGTDARPVRAEDLTTGAPGGGDEPRGATVTADGASGVAFVEGAKAQVFGRVSSAGAKVLEGGAGFSVSRTGTGAYTLTFAGGVFSVAPRVEVAVEWSGSVIGIAKVTVSSATTVLVETGYPKKHADPSLDFYLVPSDGAFSFIAME